MDAAQRLAIFVGSAILLLALTLPTTSARAQDLKLPATPPPSACLVQPRTVENFRGIAEAGITSVMGTPFVALRHPDRAELSTGAPATTTEMGAVADVVWEYLACLNGGELLASTALLTDEFLRRDMAASADSIDQLGGLEQFIANLEEAADAGSAPLDDIWGELVAVDDVQKLADGRISAVVTVRISPSHGATGPRLDRYVFRQVDGRWLIDDLEADISGSDIVVGTPTP